MLTDHEQGSQHRLLCTRMVAEYLDMPGLSLTMSQGCRLWGADGPSCAHVLSTLVASGFLRKSGEHYVRADAGQCAA